MDALSYCKKYLELKMTCTNQQVKFLGHVFWYNVFELSLSRYDEFGVKTA